MYCEDVSVVGFGWFLGKRGGGCNVRDIRKCL